MFGLELRTFILGVALLTTNLTFASAPFRAVTLNVHLGKEFKKSPHLYNYALNHHPLISGFDVLAMQEVCGPDAFGLTKNIQEIVRGHGSSTRTLNALFSSNDLQDFKHCQKGQAILTPHTVLKWGSILLPHVRENRSLLWADLSVRGDVIRIYNAHLDSRATNPFKSVQGRARQARFIIDQISDFSRLHPEVPVLLLGDFNTWSNLVDIGHREAALQLLTNFMEPSLPLDHYFRTTPRFPWQLDWIFSIGLELTKSQVVMINGLSDHYPVTADFELPSHTIALEFF